MNTMDRGTKIYATILAMFVLILAFAFFYKSPKVNDLNEHLDAQLKIKNFPYHFQVVHIDADTAIMSSPRSVDMPVSRILGFVFPLVKGLSTQSKAFQEAQKKLAETQILAKKIVLADPDINHVQWQLDRDWLLQHGIVL